MSSNIHVELIDATTKPELVLAKAGKVSHKSDVSINIDGARKFIQNIIKMKHYSVLEFAHATFLIEGISRTCSHQLVRHRLASYVQESQRYVKQSKQYYRIPPSIKQNKEANKIYNDVIKRNQHAYKQLLELGITPEDARFILPQSILTRIIMSANFREWRSILELRLDPHAQWEIRELMFIILDKLYKIAPSVFQDLVDKFKQ